MTFCIVGMMGSLLLLWCWNDYILKFALYEKKYRIQPQKERSTKHMMLHYYYYYYYSQQLPV